MLIIGRDTCPEPHSQPNIIHRYTSFSPPTVLSSILREVVGTELMKVLKRTKRHEPQMSKEAANEYDMSAVRATLPLRFSLGDRVECNMGPDPVASWARGTIIRLYYTEPGWPKCRVAAYQVELDNGRVVYAPRDEDEVIHLYVKPTKRFLQDLPLRFSLHTRVECRLSADAVSGWVAGEIIELYYRESSWPSDVVAPYLIYLDDNRTVYAPRDEDTVIRALT